MSETVPELKPAKKKPSLLHRGVYLIPPRGRRNPSWRVRWTDPDTRAIRVRTLTPLEAKSIETRRDAARKLWRDIMIRKAEIANGATPHALADTGLRPAFEKYFELMTGSVSDKTQARRQLVVERFIEWANEKGIHKVRQVTKPQLMLFRPVVVNAPRRTQATGDKRGVVVATSERRKPGSINLELRDIAGALNALRKLELLRLSPENIYEALELMTEVDNEIVFLRQAGLRQFFEACQKHDDDKWSDGRKRNKIPVRGFFATTLLSGLRSKEVRGIEATDLRLSEHGCAIRPELNHSRAHRVIDLKVSPVLTRLLTQQAVLVKSGPLYAISEDRIERLRTRLMERYGAPAFGMHALRRTCGTFLACAPSVFGAAANYMAAKQLGHSVKVAEDHYQGLVKNIPREALTIEAAMGIEDLVVDAPAHSLYLGN
jgi:integrase